MTQTMERGYAPSAPPGEQQQMYSPPPQSYGAPPRQEFDMSLFLSRWLKVWVALITVILVVVIVYLWFITGSLASINTQLGPTERNVAGAGSDVRRLPDQVQSINRSLQSIDPSLRPINGKLDEIIGALTPIDGRLKTTASSLSDTASMLRTTVGTAQGIRNTVASAQGASPGAAGTELIWRQVGGRAGDSPSIGVPGSGTQSANQVLAGGVRSDAQNIVVGLDRANEHLEAILR